MPTAARMEALLQTRLDSRDELPPCQSGVHQMFKLALVQPSNIFRQRIEEINCRHRKTLLRLCQPTLRDF